MSEQSESPFPETRWSLVQRLREPGEGASRATATEELCRLYWRPIYLYARRQGSTHADAEDLTQGFFASLLRHDTFASADRERGRLRTLLLTAFQRYQTNQWRNDNRLRRGGAFHFTSFDEYERVIGTAPDSHAAYDIAWAMTLAQEADTALANDYVSRGRGEIYRQLRPLLEWNSTPIGKTEEIAAACGLSPNAVRVALKRLRDAWRSRLEKAVAQTVSQENEVAEEVRYVCELLASAP